MGKPLLVQVIPSLGLGGAEREVVRVSKVIEASGRFHVKVCCVMGRGCFADSLDETDVDIDVLYENKRPFPISAWTLFCFLKKHRPSIMHSHLIRWAPFIGRLAGVPLVVSSEHGWSPPRSYVGILFDRMNAFFAHRIVAVSAATKDALITRWRIPARKIVVIPNAINITEALSSRAISIKKQLGISAAAPVIGILGRLVPIKGHEYFIAAAFEVLKSRKDSHFLIIGDGPSAESIKEQITALGVQDNVHMLGFRSDARDILKEIDIACLTSLSEGTPITILEAMALSKPAVVTNVGGNPEVVQDGVSGFVVPPRDPAAVGNAILRLIEDPGLAERMGLAGLRRVTEEYSEQANFDKLMKLYSDL